jgi:hypothetical protein
MPIVRTWSDPASSVVPRCELSEVAIGLGLLDLWQETWADSGMTNWIRNWRKNWIRSYDLKLDVSATIADESLNLAVTMVIGGRFE